jgi:DNA-binding GntR family transcriptional regulator
MKNNVQLPVIEPVHRPSVADQVFDALQDRIRLLELAPGVRLSEADVASQMGVSRQPVRDAFFRLSKAGFLIIRPQRSTTVSLISEAAVLQAQFIRTALETETVRIAADRLNDKDFDDLGEMMEAQRAACETGDGPLFHRLDDLFHREICARAGVEFAWDLVHENKAHMDRVRMLSLGFAARQAFDDHLIIMEQLKKRDGEAAAAAMRAHLRRIRALIQRIRAENHDWFASGPGD